MSGVKGVSARSGGSAFTSTLRGSSPCPEMDNGSPCTGVNRFWFFRPNGMKSIRYSTCECGARFPNHDEMSFSIEALLDLVREKKSPDVRQTVKETLCPEDLQTDWSRVGIIPVGTPVLHQPSRSVRMDDSGAGAFGEEMIERMTMAHGVGLAANQVGVPLRIMVHKAKGFDIHVLLNPVILERSPRVIHFEEGCLSLALVGARGEVMRNVRVLAAAGTADGRFVCMDAGGLLAIVMQHEIDHLNGIEYVQRLTPAEMKRVYKLMRRSGLDVAMVPYLGAAE